MRRRAASSTDDMLLQPTNLPAWLGAFAAGLRAAERYEEAEAAFREQHQLYMAQTRTSAQMQFLYGPLCELAEMLEGIGSHHKAVEARRQYLSAVDEFRRGHTVVMPAMMGGEERISVDARLDLSTSLELRAEALVEQGQLAEALPFAQESVGIFNQTDPDGNLLPQGGRVNSVACLVGILRGLGREEEAEQWEENAKPGGEGAEGVEASGEEEGPPRKKQAT